MRALSPARLAVLSAWGSRFASAFVNIYSLRVLSSALSAAEYATFVVIVGLSGWFALIGDLGIGYATQNSVTRRRATGADVGGDILVAYALLGVTTGCVALLTWGFSGRVSESLFANVADGGAKSHEYTLWWSGFIFTVGAAAGASNKILYALHRGYVANVVGAAASLTGFLLLNAGLATANKKVLFAVSALYGPMALFAILLAATQIKAAWHARARVKLADVVALVRGASWFLFFNAIAAAVLQVDYIIMSQKIPRLEIVQYYTIAKLFAFSSFFNQAIMFAMWPKFTEQFAAGKGIEVSSSIQKLIVYGVVLTTATTAFVMLASNPLSTLLSPGTPIEFRYTIIAGFGALALIRCLTDPYAIFLQSIGNIKPLIFFAAIQAPIGGTLQWILAGDLGVEGILLGLVLSFLLTVAWGLPSAARRSLMTARQT